MRRNNMKEGITKEKDEFNYHNNKMYSRKWRLVLLIILISTVGVFVPPIVSSWIFQSIKPLVIITGTEYVSLITLVVSGYFGINIWQKHLAGRYDELVKYNDSVRYNESMRYDNQMRYDEQVRYDGQVNYNEPVQNEPIQNEPIQTEPNTDVVEVKPNEEGEA